MIRLLSALLIIVATSLSAKAENSGSEWLHQQHLLAGKIWSMQEQAFLEESVLLRRLTQADIVLLGETHDNPLHHQLQRQLLQHKIDQGERPALVMEQFDAVDQQKLDEAMRQPHTSEALQQASELLRFSDKAFYLPLVSVAHENQLPLVAANISRQQLRDVIYNGYADIALPEQQRLHLKQVWSPARADYMFDHMGGVHCGQLNDDMRLGLAKAQRLRDAYMTDQALPWVDQGLVVILGRDHARHDIGMPLYFAARAPEARLLSIGFVEVDPDKLDPSVYAEFSATAQMPYDVIWFTPRVNREDPCADFGQHKMAQPDAG